MRILTWNLNHRARQRRIPEWVVPAMAAQFPHLVVLTEYVAGPDHEKFLAGLASVGLICNHISVTEGAHNQVLMASRESLTSGTITGPLSIHPSLPSNVLHVVLENSGMDVLGFRMPAYIPRNNALKRATWQWLQGAAAQLQSYRAVIVGDLNTAPGDPESRCGDCLDALIRAGWQHAAPATGYSWKHGASGSERKLDHAFCSRLLVSERAEYSWSFQSMGEDAASAKVGRPDHAMLITEFS